ncbi:homeodomain protein [Pholiota molesta]|nr:homeodomain protein [Pholiota molesta]
MDLELMNTMDSSLEHFLTSLKGGNDALSSFLGRWKSLSTTLQSHRDHLNEETLANAHYLASTIDTIASVMLELDTHRDVMERQLAKDLSHILNDDMENLVIRDESPISPGHGSIPPYIKPCSQWLLDNLHNPYPPKSIRNSICRQTGSSIKDLDAWFTDARKRIGWNQLRRTHFSNRREKIIDAATSFFKPSPQFLKLDSSPDVFPLSKTDDYSMAFVEMEERAQRLFSDKFEVTPLALTLDHIVRDLQPLSQMQNQPNQPESQTQQTNPTLKRTYHAYPSPEHSPERSPEQLPLSNIAISSLIPPSAASHKRRRSSSETVFDDIGLDRPQKRSRPTSTQHIDDALAAASLPSPAASLDEFSSPVGNELLLLPSMTPPAPAMVSISAPAQPIPSTKRKRCFSDSEDQRPSKYLQPTPLSRIVSDPLPMPNDPLHDSSVEDLLQNYLLNQPFSVDITSPSFNAILDDSTPIEVNYYQYSLSPVGLNTSLQAELILQDFTCPSAPLQDTIELLPSFELNTLDEGLQVYNLPDFLNAENSVYGTELGPLLQEPNCFQFSGMPTLDEPSIQTSSAFDWMTFLNQPIDIHSASEAVLNQSSPVPTLGYSTAIERAAKQKRAEFLRAELQRLEADIA